MCVCVYLCVSSLYIYTYNADIFISHITLWNLNEKIEEISSVSARRWRLTHQFTQKQTKKHEI